MLYIYVFCNNNLSYTTMTSTLLVPRPHGIFEDMMESLHDILTSIGKIASGNMMNLRLCENYC